MYVLKVDAHQAEEIAYLQGQNPYFRGFALTHARPRRHAASCRVTATA